MTRKMTRTEWKTAFREWRATRRLSKGLPTQLYAIVDQATGKTLRRVLGLKNARNARGKISDMDLLPNGQPRFILNKA